MVGPSHLDDDEKGDTSSKKEVQKRKRKELRKIRRTIKQIGRSPEELKRLRIFLDTANLHVDAIQ